MQPATKLYEQSTEKRGWIVKQLTLIAEAKGAAVTPARLRLNSEDLMDIPAEALQQAFVRVRKELDWYPQVSQIREMALGKPQDNLEAGASKAWDDVQKFLRKWGWNPLPVWSVRARDICPPSFDERTERAIRCVGGLKAIEYADEKTFSFMKRDFMAEWIRFEAAEKQPSALLASAVQEFKQLVESSNMAITAEKESGTKSKRQLTDAEIEARRKELAHQAKVMQG